MKMRILHVFDHSIPLHSGYTFRSLAILKGQRELGYETIHLTSPKHFAYQGDDLEEQVDGFHFYRTKTDNGLIDKLPVINQLGVIRETKKRIDIILDNEKVDVIQAHSPCLNGLAALWSAKKNNIPVVYEMRASWEDAAVNHGTCKEGDLRYRLSRALETYVLKKADAITTICEGLETDIKERGIDENKITVIPNGVDINSFSFNGKPENSLQQQFDLTGNTVLGFIGSFYEYEGLALLIEALPDILKSRPKIKLLLVGGGIQEDFLKQKVQKLDLKDNVIFVGRIPHEEINKYYNLVDIFLYPRLSMRLTEIVTPLKPLEAMAQGKLVIASDIGGHREMIKNGENGLLFDAGNKNDLVEKVLQMTAQQNKWQKFRDNARKYVEEQRSWKTCLSGYQNVINFLHHKPVI